MGVRGLTSWLREHGAEISNMAVLPSGSLVIIDGNGLAFHVLRALSWSAMLGGYAEIDAATRSFLATLQQAGLEPAVFLDGRATRLKAGTISSRRRCRADTWESLQIACLDGRAVPKAELPEPGMLLESVLSTIESLPGVRVVHCVGEADVEMARACSHSRRAKARDAFIFANDSDFLLHEGVQYVPFDELSLDSGGGGGHNGSGGAYSSGACVMGRVWSRSLLSEIANLSEERLIEWAMLLGNDATAPFFAPAAWRKVLSPEMVAATSSDGLADEAFLEALEDGMASDEEDEMVASERLHMGTAEAVRQFLVADPYEGVLEAALKSSPTSDDLRRAMAYSRALYANGDLESFPLDRTRCAPAHHARAPHSLVPARNAASPAPLPCAPRTASLRRL